MRCKRVQTSKAKATHAEQYIVVAYDSTMCAVGKAVYVLHCSDDVYLLEWEELQSQDWQK